MTSHKSGMAHRAAVGTTRYSCGGTMTTSSTSKSLLPALPTWKRTSRSGQGGSSSGSGGESQVLSFPLSLGDRDTGDLPNEAHVRATAERPVALGLRFSTSGVHTPRDLPLPSQQ